MTDTPTRTPAEPEWLVVAFVQAIQRALENQATLSDLVAVLRMFKASGVTQETAYASLQAMRAVMPSENKEDRLLEVMDVVSGWCSSDLYVWESRLER